MAEDLLPDPFIPESEPVPHSGPELTYNTRTREWEPIGGAPVKKPVRADMLNFHDFLMPFGGHVGEKLAEIETSYLQWVIRECGGNLYPVTKLAIELELRSRNE